MLESLVLRYRNQCTAFKDLPVPDDEDDVDVPEDDTDPPFHKLRAAKLVVALTEDTKILEAFVELALRDPTVLARDPLLKGYTKNFRQELVEFLTAS